MSWQRFPHDPALLLRSLALFSFAVWSWEHLRRDTNITLWIYYATQKAHAVAGTHSATRAWSPYGGDHCKGFMAGTNEASVKSNNKSANASTEFDKLSKTCSENGREDEEPSSGESSETRSPPSSKKIRKKVSGSTLYIYIFLHLRTFTYMWFYSLRLPAAYDDINLTVWVQLTVFLHVEHLHFILSPQRNILTTIFKSSPKWVSYSLSSSLDLPFGWAVLLFTI